MNKPYLYADFNNADSHGRLRLNCSGTIDDLSLLGIELKDGLSLILHDEDLETEGRAEYSPDEQIWVAVIDWQRMNPRAAGLKPHSLLQEGGSSR